MTTTNTDRAATLTAIEADAANWRAAGVSRFWSSFDMNVTDAKRALAEVATDRTELKVACAIHGACRHLYGIGHARTDAAKADYDQQIAIVLAR